MFSKTNVRKSTDYLIKVAVLSITVYWVYVQMNGEKDLSSLSGELLNRLQGPEQLLLIVLCILLMPVNWALEALKWKMLLKSTITIPWPVALKSIFSGISIGSFTPNRLGDYLGRLFFLNKSHKSAGIKASILGNIAQLSTTVFWGCIGGMTFLAQHLHYAIDWTTEYTGLMQMAFGGIAVLTILLYLNIHRLVNTLQVKLIKAFPKYREELSALKRSSLAELYTAFILSTIRYLTFCFQLYLLLKVFQINLSYLTAMSIISCLYLIISCIPSFLLSELGIRGSVGLFLFGLYFESKGGFLATHKLGVVASSSFLWMLNLLLPTIIGSIIILYRKRKSASTNKQLCTTS